MIPAKPSPGHAPHPRPWLGRRAVALAMALAAGLTGPSALRAQPIWLTAGEHADFTRIVAQSARDFPWDLTEDGADLRLRLPGRPVRLNLDQFFARIPRDRLASARLDGEVLVLTRACPCPVTAVPDRTGVLVLDLSDPGPASPDAAVAPPVPPAGPVQPGGLDTRGVGLALARRLASASPPAPGDAAAPDAAPTLGPPDALRAGLAGQLAQAVAQGLIDGPAPALTTGPTAQTLPQAADLPDLPELPPNLRLRGAADPGPPPVAADPAPGAACPDPQALAFLTPQSQIAFAVSLGTARARLYGEFDTADPGARLDLARHYIAWGLGTEARHLLDASGADGEEATLLAALADTLDGAASNRRQILAGLADCAGPVAAFAALAGAPDGALARAGAAIAAQVQAMPPALRWAIGPDLVDRLLAAGAVEPARMILDTLRRAPAPGTEPPPVLARLEAGLERARGALDRAAGQLDAGPGDDLATRALALQIALERGLPAEVAVLADLVSLAEPLRRTEPARAAVELAVRHHRLAGRIGTSLALADRLESWLDPTPSARARLAILRDEGWSAAAELPDAAFLDLVLARGDWRDPAVSAAARARIAERLRALGLRVEEGAAPAAPADPQAIPPFAPAAEPPDARSDGPTDAAPRPAAALVSSAPPPQAAPPANGDPAIPSGAAPGPSDAATPLVGDPGGTDEDAPVIARPAPQGATGPGTVSGGPVSFVAPAPAAGSAVEPTIAPPPGRQDGQRIVSPGALVPGAALEPDGSLGTDPIPGGSQPPDGGVNRAAPGTSPEVAIRLATPPTGGLAGDPGTEPGAGVAALAGGAPVGAGVSGPSDEADAMVRSAQALAQSQDLRARLQALSLRE